MDKLIYSTSVLLLLLVYVDAIHANGPEKSPRLRRMELFQTERVNVGGDVWFVCWLGGRHEAQAPSNQVKNYKQT